MSTTPPSIMSQPDDSGVQQVAAPTAPAQTQAPAQPAAPTQPAPAQPSVTTPPVAPSPNQRLHSFVSSVLGGISSSLAGKPATKYTTDAAGRTVADPNQPKDTMGDQWRRIGAAALTGLGAGAKAGGQKSGLANALSGLGAGAEAQVDKSQAQDKLAREQEKQNAEAVAQKELRTHEIARGNALTYATIQEQRRIEEDRDPHRQQAMGWAKAAEDAGVPVEYTGESDLKKRAEDDPQFLTTHQILPIGAKPVSDAQGQPVMDENGQPKMEHQFALIDGLHNGSMPAPESFVSDLKKYGKYAGITGTESLKAGDDISMEHFIKMANGIQEGKKKELDGWAKAQLSWQGDKPVLVNATTSEVKPFSNDPKVIPNAANKPESADSKNALTDAQAAEAKAKTQEALANAALAAQQLNGSGTGQFDKTALPAYMEAVSNLPAQSQALLKAVRPQDQLALLAVASGDADLAKTFPTRTTAKSGQMDAQHATTLVKLLNPDYNAQYFKAVQEGTDYMVKGKGHDALQSFGQFLNHADEARQRSEALTRTTNSPWLDKSLNEIRSKGLGLPEVNNLQTAIMAARSEWNSFIHSGHAPTQAEVEDGRTLMNDASTPRQILGVLNVMGKQAVGRLDLVNEQYKTLAHRDWPNLIAPSARQSAINLGLAEDIKKYTTGGTLRGALNAGSSLTEQPKTSFAPGTHTFDSKAWATNNPGKDVNAAIAKAKAQGFEVK